MTVQFTLLIPSQEDWIHVKIRGNLFSKFLVSFLHLVRAVSLVLITWPIFQAYLKWAVGVHPFVMSRWKSFLEWVITGFLLRKLSLFFVFALKWWTLLVSHCFYFWSCHVMNCLLGSVCSCREWPLLFSSLVCFCSCLYVNAVVIACDAFPGTCLVHMLLLRNSWWDICFSGIFHQTAFFQYFLVFLGFIYQVWTFSQDCIVV